MTTNALDIYNSDDEIAVINSGETIEIIQNVLNATNIISGSGVPSTTPTSIGLIYIDTTNNRAYLSIGTTAASNWREIFIDSGGS